MKELENCLCEKEHTWKKWRGERREVRKETEQKQTSGPLLRKAGKYGPRKEKVREGCYRPRRRF